MRIAILHPAIAGTASLDDQDTLVQAEALGRLLLTLGHAPVDLACTLDLDDLKSRLAALKPDLVFNLVETLDGRGSLIHLVPFLLDALRIPYTGCGAEAILLTSNKVLAKDRLVAAGLPTPAWIGPFPGGPPRLSRPPAKPGPGRWIVKSVWEHASIGLDETAELVFDESDGLASKIGGLSSRFGGACFAERFIEGREFNLSLIAGHGGPEVLRPAEILFEGFPPGALRIVGYRAKWDESSYEYHHTPRRFDFPPQDAGLLEELRRLALGCWQAFGLRGYARVDFRVDAAGSPWILEVNTNPCLSPDAGFAAALEASGMTYHQGIQNIIADASANGD
jgi:D-alanine-D-alanine ligase